MLFPKFIYVPDFRIGYDVYTFHAFECDWQLTICRREDDQHSIIGMVKYIYDQPFRTMTFIRFDGCLTPEGAYSIIKLALQQWREGFNHGQSVQQIKVKEALGL